MRLAYLGTPEIACPALKALRSAGHEVAAVVTQPDRPAGRGQKLSRCAVAQLADELALPVWQPQRARELAEPLAQLQPEALVVMAFGQILPQAILDIPRLGALNVHTSLLPALRGAAPISRAIMQGLAQTGVTTMYMDAGVDTGDICLQETTPILAQDTALTLAGRLASQGAVLISRTLDLLAQGKAPRTPQRHGDASYAPLLAKSEGLVDWNRPAQVLDWLVRGADPWPGAFTYLEGQPLKLFAPTLVIPSQHGAPPGSILPPDPANPDFLLVACGDNILGLGQVQAAGKKRMPAGQFLRGARLPQGTCLGQA